MKDGDDPYFSCGQCGYRTFRNPKTTVTLILVNEEKNILLTKRAIDPFRGMWGTPGGFVDIGERAEDAIIREAREELGIDLTEVSFVRSGLLSYPYDGVDHTLLELAFSARVPSGVIVGAHDDVSEAVFFTPKDIPYDHFAFPSQKENIDAFLRARSNEHAS